MRLAFFYLSFFVQFWFCSAAIAAGPTIDVRLMSADGRPLANASVGTHAYGESGAEPRWKFFAPNAKSDDSGIARLKFERPLEKRTLLYALSHDSKLAAFTELSSDELTQPVEIKLLPACRMHGRLASADLAAVNRQMDWTNVYLFRDKDRCLQFMSREQEFEFYLPPGEYRLQAYGTYLHSTNKDVVVDKDKDELDLGSLDLPATNLAKLIGRPAPELQEIKAWRNGEPVKLADLRGKAVVLDFWGYWCGPCVHSMPDLISLYDDYHEHGLEVIAVHDDSLADGAALDAKLSQLRDAQWHGRGLPFTVVLDGGATSEGANRKSHGATTAAYGITGFPTSVLIDPEGNVVGEFYATSKEDLKLLRKMLGMRGDETDSTEAVAPTWKKQFDAVYQLKPDEVIKRIPKPFIPERQQFVTRAGRYQGLGLAPQSIVIWAENRRRFTEDTFGELLESLASPASVKAVFDCPRKLQQMTIEGDWMIRYDSPLDARLAALEKILAAELDRHVHFEPIEVGREAIVVTGNYKFQPMPGSVDGKSLALTTVSEDDISERGGGAGSAVEFFDFLSRMTARPVINESEIDQKLELNWRQRESAIANLRAANSPQLAAILANLQKQTGLTFKLEPRKVRIWRVSADE
jgi:thiol-disulfide isomerase/thioredoxin